MEGDPSFTGGLSWALRFLGDVAFRWVPGTVQVMTGTAPDPQMARPILVPITEPVSAMDVLNFLQTAAPPGAYDRLYANWGVFVAFSVLVSLLISAAIIYCLIRLMQIRHMERQRLLAAAHPVAARDVSKAQLRWNHILEQIASESHQDWRLAILEADIMLNELLDVQGYRGDTMADKMKTVERADFKTIDLAWEAHRVRNALAHQGSLQELQEREARRVVGLYEQIFREFRFID